MAIGFTESKGSASTGKIDHFKYTDGTMRFRLVGGILPRYVYWIKNAKKDTIPLDCLKFNRDLEKFDESLPDPVQEYGFKHVDFHGNLVLDKQGKEQPRRCQYGYVINVINLTNGKVELLTLKKTVFEEIDNVRRQLGVSPTDTVNGFDIVMKREKTGPKAYNVKYVLQQLLCKQRPLTEEELETVSNARTVDELLPLPTADEQRATITKFMKADEDTTDEQVDSGSVNELED